MRRSFLLAALGFLFNTAGATATQENPEVVRKLAALSAQDNFAPAPPFYPGAHDPALRARLNTQFRAAVSMFITAAEQKARKQQYLSLLKSEIEKFNRVQLDSEDAEQVATNFEHIMDCVGLESSNGILNNWVYGFNPR